MRSSRIADPLRCGTGRGAVGPESWLRSQRSSHGTEIRGRLHAIRPARSATSTPHSRLPDSRWPAHGQRRYRRGGGRHRDRADVLPLEKRSEPVHARRRGDSPSRSKARRKRRAIARNRILYRAEVRSVIPLARATINMRSWTADGGNVSGHRAFDGRGEPIDVTLKLWSHTSPLKTQAGAADGLIWATREAVTVMGTTRQPFASKVAMATRVVGADPKCSTDGKSFSEARFSVPAGKTVRVVTAVGGGYNAENHYRAGEGTRGVAHGPENR